MEATHMAIPLENVSGPFTPPSLTNLPKPPTFQLRAGTWRDKNRYRHMLQSEGLNWHSQQDIRDETIRGIHEGYSPELAADLEARMKDYWDAISYYVRENADATDSEPFSHPFEKKAAIVIAEMASGWRPLSIMAADNVRFDIESRLVAVALFVDGWTGIDVPFARENGSVSLERVNDVADALAQIEQDHALSGIEGIGAPSTAFNELVSACLGRLSLDKATEKNSSSPPPASDDPNGSLTDGQDKSPGTSKASASSNKTRAA
jgi:hypothetical protein